MQQGEVIAVMEAMKMEMQIAAHQSGRITLRVTAGSYQSAGDVLAFIAL